METGPTSAFKAELVGCIRRSLNFARKLARSEADAEDLVQDAFEKALKSWDSFETGTDMQKWLNKIVKNNFLDRQKSHPVSKTDTVGDDDYLLDQETPHRGLASIITDEVQDYLYNAISADERSTLMLSAEGYSYAEIMEELDMSRSNVGVTLFRAREKLYNKFGPSGG